MKYSVDIEIDRSINEVVDLFRNRDNFKFWMEGLLSVEPVSGKQGEEGAKSTFKFNKGKREMEMVETIDKVNFPQSYSVTYEANGVYNTVTSKFEKLSENKTKYTNETEFKFKGFMKLMGMLMPGAFKKQSRKYLEDFKYFVENKKASFDS